MSLPQIIARPLLAGVFVYGGLDAARRPETKLAAAEPLAGAVADAAGLPPVQVVRINGLVQVVAGAALALGVLPRPAAAVLAASLVPTTLAGHRFWEKDTAAERKAHTIHFLKNAALLGGLLLAATGTGGRPSLPWLARRQLHQVADVTSHRLAALNPAA